MANKKFHENSICNKKSHNDCIYIQHFWTSSLSSHRAPFYFLLRMNEWIIEWWYKIYTIVIAIWINLYFFEFHFQMLWKIYAFLSMAFLFLPCTATLFIFYEKYAWSYFRIFLKIGIINCKKFNLKESSSFIIQVR